MPFGTSIQTYDGAHASHQVDNPNCAVDWANDRIWFAQAPNNANYISRYGFTTGAEQAFATMGSIISGLGSSGSIGWDTDGNIYMSGPNALGNGSLTKIDGTALTFIHNTSYPAHFGGSNTITLKVGATQYILDHDAGGGIGSLDNTQLTAGTAFSGSYSWSAPDGAYICMGAPGTSFGYLFSASGSETCTLSALNLPLGTSSVLRTYVPADFDITWTGIVCWGMALDQFDGNPICYLGGNSGESVRLVKLNKASGAIVWNVSVPWSNQGPGYQFAQSRILHQRLALLSVSPNTITVYNTADGSVVSSQTTGLAGLSIHKQQAYDDTSGAIVGYGDYTPTAGGPTPLNGSTGPFSGWYALYVTQAITTVTRRFLSESGPIRMMS
jgi:hypothetical protein